MAATVKGAGVGTAPRSILRTVSSATPASRAAGGPNSPSSTSSRSSTTRDGATPPCTCAHRWPSKPPTGCDRRRPQRSRLSRLPLRNHSVRLAGLAWVLAQGQDVVPIHGTRRSANLQENSAAAAIELSAAELSALEQAAPAGVAAGGRYAPRGRQTSTAEAARISHPSRRRGPSPIIHSARIQGHRRRLPLQDHHGRRVRSAPLDTRLPNWWSVGAVGPAALKRASSSRSCLSRG